MASKKEKVNCVDCEHWKRIDVCSGLCSPAVGKGNPNPVTGEGFSCDKGKPKTPTAPETIAKQEPEAPEAPC